MLKTKRIVQHKNLVTTECFEQLNATTADLTGHLNPLAKSNKCNPPTTMDTRGRAYTPGFH